MASQGTSDTTLLGYADQSDLSQPGATLELCWNIFSVNMGSLDKEESRYVLAITKLTLNHARNLQWIIDTFQLDAALFFANYELKNKPEAQMFVNAMIAGYIGIYENLANRLSPVLYGKRPIELVHLGERLSSNDVYTKHRGIRNSCAHEANVKSPLAGTTTENSSVFRPRVFFEHLEASIRPLIVELATLVGIMKHNPNNHRERTEVVELYGGDAPVSATPDSGSHDPNLPDPNFDWGESEATGDWPSDGSHYRAPRLTALKTIRRTKRRYD